LSKKLQQFWIRKINCERLRENNYKLNLPLEQARLNQEIVAISDSQLVRSLHLVSKKEFSQVRINDLLSERKKIANKKNGKLNRQRVSQINIEVDNLLFVPELVSISFSDKRHADKLFKMGYFIVDDLKFFPFMASSGMIRRNTMLFAREDVIGGLLNTFENGRNKEKELVPAKYGVYLSLYSSSSLSVTFPRICVVKDKTIETERLVDFSRYIDNHTDPITEPEIRKLSLNAFDGQGLVSPKMAKLWSQDLEIDYIPSSFIVRGSFIKGLCVTFDFHKFAKENNKAEIIDIYGNTVKIKDVDAIISESQFKLWDSYPSTEYYLEKCEENNLGWGISRFSPKEEKSYGFSSYQFIQSLSLDDASISDICKPTEEWIKNVSGLSIENMLLYSLGDLDFSDKWFNNIEYQMQALILENSLINDSYFLRYFDKILKRKKNDACMGRLVFPANYQFLISDPYAQCCHIFNTNFSYLLEEGSCYSKYWNDKKSERISLVRSPITHYSEVDVLNLKTNSELLEWYKYLNSGIVLPPFGISLDMAILGGADVDGDSCFSTNYEPFINGKQEGFPIFYDSTTADKKKIDNQQFVLTEQAKGFGSKVGFLTNVGSTISSVLDNYEKDSLEYKILSGRYKFTRTAQGYELDKQKGLVIPPFPDWWTKKKKLKNDMSEEEIAITELNNSLAIQKRPIFFKYLYEYMMKKWRKEYSVYDNVSRTIYGIKLSDLLDGERTSDQNSLVEEYNRKSSFVNNNSVMNKVSRYMERVLSDVRLNKKNQSKNFDYSVLLSSSFKIPNKNELDKMKLLFKEYKSLKRAVRENRLPYDETNYSSLDQIKKYINGKGYSSISSSPKELGDLAVYLCYSILGDTSKVFIWDCYGKEVVSNMLDKRSENFVRIPKKSKTGNIDYLFEKYGMFLMNIE
jgi:hypothetical protein